VRAYKMVRLFGLGS